MPSCSLGLASAGFSGARAQGSAPPSANPRSVSTRFGGKHKTIGAVGEFEVIAVYRPNVVGRLDQFLISRLDALPVHLQLSEPAVRDDPDGDTAWTSHRHFARAASDSDWHCT